MNNELKQQYKLRITSANKTELVVILYEMYLQYVQEAKDALQTGNKPAFKDALSHARGCVKELMNSLNFDYSPAQELKQLYIYVNKELVEADLHGKTEHLDNTIKVMTELWEAYKEISSQDTSPAVMTNSQSIYAGLTYGKSDLVENLDQVGENRGFLV
ncbi:MAG: flagellar protein FliS [Lachnospiraceae bacterium]|nr:flagellar protein FliS [Oscillospiraceae bacterium]MBQ7067437.1 flagellar protein FliS [Lachnospiraceae bacterium]